MSLGAIPLAVFASVREVRATLWSRRRRRSRAILGCPCGRLSLLKVFTASLSAPCSAVERRAPAGCDDRCKVIEGEGEGEADGERSASAARRSSVAAARD